MQISPTAGSGLSTTSAAIVVGQQRFDVAADQVVADTMAMAGETPAADSGAADLVGMQADAVSNSILYGVFRRQAEQQRQAIDLLAPAPASRG